MKIKIHFFYRHPLPLYFSIEKLFKEIANEIRKKHLSEWETEEKILPCVSKWLTIFRNILFVRKNQSRINHVTGDVHYAILGCSRKNLNVLTIHDCVILKRYPSSSFRHRIIKWLWYDLPVRKADAVTVISENTLKEVVHFTDCDEGKIRVVRNFVDPVFVKSDHVFNSQNPRILFIGTTPNKNIERMIEAVEGSEYILDIVGVLNENQKEMLKSKKIRYEQSANLSKEALIQKYKRCDIVAFPSTYEGFGLPIIEAQAVGRPVLTSNIPPMKETAGEGACLIDCHSSQSIREGLNKIAGDDVYRQLIIEKGFENVKRFSLERVTDQYLSVYKEFLGKKFKAKH